MIYTKWGFKNKPNFLQTATAEQIQGYTNLVRQGLDLCILPPYNNIFSKLFIQKLTILGYNKKIPGAILCLKTG